MSDKETGLSRVSSMREAQAILYEYREEDIQIPYLLAECVDYLMAERKRLQEAWRDAVKALRATDALLDPLLMEHRNRIDDNAPIIAALQEDKDE